MFINGNNGLVNPAGFQFFNQPVNPGMVSFNQANAFNTAQQSPTQQLGGISGLLAPLLQGLQQNISANGLFSNPASSTNQNIPLGNGQFGNLQFDRQPNSFQFNGQANNQFSNAQINGQGVTNTFQFGGNQPGGFQFGTQPGGFQFGGGQPINFQPGNVGLTQNNISLQFSNQNNVQFTQQQPIFQQPGFTQQPVFQQPGFTQQQPVFQQPTIQGVSPQQFFQQQAIQLASQQPQVQQMQQAPQQDEPRGQGMLAQLLGPIGGTSSRLFGDIPIIGDILNITSPIALDLNGDGGIGVTGQSTAKDAQRTTLGQTVNMDLNADGQAENVEWLKGDGDAMLVDNRDGQALAQGIDGTRLFGDEGGRYDNGYQKLAKLDSNQDGQLAGQELQGLQAWVDNGDGVATASELVDVTDLGMTSMDVNMQNVAGAQGENFMRSSATINGQQVMTEDVWFASQG